MSEEAPGSESKATKKPSIFASGFSFQENIKKFLNLKDKDKEEENEKNKEMLSNIIANSLYKLGNIDLTANKGVFHNTNLRKELSNSREAIVENKDIEEINKKNSLISKKELIEKANIKSSLFKIDMDKLDHDLSEEMQLERSKEQQLNIALELEEERQEKNLLEKLSEDKMLMKILTLSGNDSTKSQNPSKEANSREHSSIKGIDKIEGLPSIKSTLNSFDNYNITISDTSTSKLGNLSPSSGMMTGKDIKDMSRNFF